MPVYTVDQAAARYAAWKLEEQQVTPAHRPQYERRYIWDAKVLTFNASTVAAIVTLVTAIFRTSPFMLILSGLFWAIRHAVMDNLDRTGLQNPWPAQDVHDLLAQRSKERIKGHFEFPGAWEPVHSQFLQFRAWMNLAPAVNTQYVANPQPPPAGPRVVQIALQPAPAAAPPPAAPNAQLRAEVRAAVALAAEEVDVDPVAAEDAANGEWEMPAGEAGRQV